MQHILKISREELERTHSLVENYKTSWLKEIFFSLFGTSFKTVLFKYAHQKEEILMNYSSLYSDFSKDISDCEAKSTDISEVRESILYITQTIEKCWKTLEHLIAHSHRQEEILSHEKFFFTQLLESFNSDLLNWVQAHEREIFWEISKIETVKWKTKLESWKALLELQKKRLESHMKNISNI